MNCPMKKKEGWLWVELFEALHPGLDFVVVSVGFTFEAADQLADVGGIAQGEAVGDPCLRDAGFAGKGPGNGGAGAVVGAAPGLILQCEVGETGGEDCVGGEAFLLFDGGAAAVGAVAGFGEFFGKSFAEGLAPPVPAALQGAVEVLGGGEGDAACLPVLKAGALFQMTQEYLPMCGGVIEAAEGKPGGHVKPGEALFRRASVSPGKAAPWIGQEVGIACEQGGADGVEVDVVEEGGEVLRWGTQAAVVLGIDEDGLVPSAEEVAPCPVTGGKAAGVGVLKPLHALDEIGVRGANDQMVVIGHQGEGQNLPVCFFDGFAQGGEKHGAVLVGAHDGLALVAPCQHVVVSARIDDARLSGHGVKT